MEVNIQIERRSKTLDQGDRARLGHLVGMARFLDQVRGNDAVNDAQHPPHDLGPAGKQETQLKREAQPWFVCNWLIFSLHWGGFGEDILNGYELIKYVIKKIRPTIYSK